MKRFLTISLMLVCTLLIEAQNISVSSFRLLENDLDANTAGTMERDQNGEVAALIKVATTQIGFTFDGGSLGIVKTVQKPTEIWVYVPRGLKKITISHPQLGVLRDYYLPVTIASAKTYEMVLVTGMVDTTIRQARTSQYVVFQLSPPDAFVELDDEVLATDEGTATKLMEFGTYNYRAQAPNYFPEAGNVTVNDPNNKHVVNIALKPNFSSVTLKVDGNAEIWVNGERKGTGSWTGNLGAGTYVFEAKKENHRDSYMSRSIILTSEPQTITLQAPTPILGRADIKSSPAKADIYIDGKKVGQTPHLVPDLLVGQHEVRISKQGFLDNISTITVNKGKTTKLSAKLEIPVVEVVTVGNVSFKMVRVDGGTFQMGAASEQDEDDVYYTEKPVHQVTLSDYYIGETEVTQALWEVVMGSNPSLDKGPNRAVENVSWNKCQEFIKKLNQMTGRKFRLPTEAEWEFAARGGNRTRGYKYSGSNNIDDVAWFCDNSNGQVHDVKTKMANELGLFDMSGNVCEWVQDWFGTYRSGSQINPTGPLSGDRRVNRGGGWFYLGRLCRVSSRNLGTPQLPFYGLRLACDNNSTLTVREGEISMLTAQHEKPEVEQTVAVSNSGATSFVGNQVITVDNASFAMVRVEGGTFTMGATSEQGSDALDKEKPAHQVTLSSYYIEETEVTQALWVTVMGSNPSRFKEANNPVENVSWNDCQEFIHKLNQMTGRKFRLPTEAEWEFAARGGNKTHGYMYSGSNSINDVAWFANNSNRQMMHAVKTKQANEIGLYDMSGNVWEWCQDWYGKYSSDIQTNPMGPSSGHVRVYRGGGWNGNAGCCRVSYRTILSPDKRNDYLGLRLAL